MEKISFPFGRKELDIEIEKDQLQGVLVSKAHQFKAEKSESQIVKEALDNPINSQKLSELVKNKKEVVIISSDHTRPVPSHITMPLLLEEIKKGSPEAEITF